MMVINKLYYKFSYKNKPSYNKINIQKIIDDKFISDTNKVKLIKNCMKSDKKQILIKRSTVTKITIIFDYNH